MNQYGWSHRLFWMLVFLLSLTGIGCSDRGAQYKNLPDPEKFKLFEREKTNLIYQRICNNFTEELDAYKSDLRKKELRQLRDYFRDYPFQFHVMQMEPLYPAHERLIALGLEAKGIVYNPSFKDWDPPDLKDLDCQNTINEWSDAKSQWKMLQETLPAEYFKQNGLWDKLSHYIGELYESGQKAFYTLLFSIIIGGFTIYTFILHYALLSKHDKSGLWLIPLMPICALYWQNHIGYLKDKGYDFTTRIFITAFLLSALFFLASSIASRILKAINLKDHNNLERGQVCSEDVQADLYVTALFVTIEAKSIEALKRLIDLDVDLIEERNPDGLTALQLISSGSLGMTKDHIDMARVLLASGANPNSVTLSGLSETSLHLVSKHGSQTSENHIHLAELLLENGCDVDAKNSLGFTVYRQILEHGAPELLPLLETVLARQPEPVLQFMRSEGSIALQGESELIERAEIYEHFLFLSLVDVKYDGLSLMLGGGLAQVFLHVAEGNCSALLATLWSNPEAVHARNPDGWTPLHLVASLGPETRQVHAEVAAILLEAGAIVDSRTPLGWTPLHMVALNGSAESIPVLEVLFQYETDPCAVANDGVTNWRILWQHGDSIYRLIDRYETKRRP